MNGHKSLPEGSTVGDDKNIAPEEMTYSVDKDRLIISYLWQKGTTSIHDTYDVNTDVSSYT